jgi:hypothetical protein
MYVHTSIICYNSLLVESTIKLATSDQRNNYTTVLIFILT